MRDGQPGPRARASTILPHCSWGTRFGGQEERVVSPGHSLTLASNHPRSLPAELHWQLLHLASYSQQTKHGSNAASSRKPLIIPLSVRKNPDPLGTFLSLRLSCPQCPCCLPSGSPSHDLCVGQGWGLVPLGPQFPEVPGTDRCSSRH